MTDEEMAYPPGLALHGNSYRITKRVPHDLLTYYGGKNLLRYTTGTADKAAAADIAWRWHAETVEEFARIRETGNAAKTCIPPAELSWLIDSMVSSTLEAHEKGLTAGSTEEQRLATAAFEELKEYTRAAFTAGEFAGTAPIADDWLDSHGYDLAEDSEDRKRVLFAFAKGLSIAFQGLESRRNGHWIATPPRPDLSTATQSTAALTLSAVVEAFIAKADKTRPMFKKTEPVLRMFLEVIGDKPVNTIRPLDIDVFFRLLCKLPPRWHDEQRKRGCTVAALAEMTWPACITPKTFEDGYMAAIRPFLRDSIRLYGDMGFPKTLSTDNIKYTGTQKAGVNTQRALHPDELLRLFNGPECAAFAAAPTQAYCYWLPLVGLYTGARVNEVCQLNPQCDIVAEGGIWFFNITEDSEAADGVRKSVKNAPSYRRVPIHSHLLTLGFLNYFEQVKASGEKLLFPTWLPSQGKASGRAERWFRRHLRALGLRDETPFSKIVGFHCFRHTLLTRAEDLEVAGAGRITGHSDPTTTKEEKGYKRKLLPLPLMQKILEKISFDIDPPRPV